MTKIQPVIILKRTSLKEILRKEKIIKNMLQDKQTDVPKFSVTIIKPKQNDEFDSFIKSTAKDIIKKIPNYKLNVITKDEITSMIPQRSLLSENSIWAPWSKMLKK